MSQNTLFFASISLSLLFGVGVSLYLRKPLHILLVDICGTVERASFWTNLTIISYILVSAAVGLSYRPDYDIPLYYGLGGHLGRTLFGLLLVTGFVAMTISRFIRRQERIARQPQQG
jgi:hypothetical protein